MTDEMLEPPTIERPPSTYRQHGDHWDATSYYTRDGGWSWKQTSAVNLRDEAAAIAWLARVESAQ